MLIVNCGLRENCDIVLSTSFIPEHFDVERKFVCGESNRILHKYRSGSAVYGIGMNKNLSNVTSLVPRVTITACSVKKLNQFEAKKKAFLGMTPDASFPTNTLVCIVMPVRIVFQ
jgi:hypothetical protein